MLRRRPVMRAAVGTAVVAGTATAVSGRVRRRQDRRYQTQADAYEQQQYAPQQYAEPAAPPPAPAPAPAAAPAMTTVEQLTQLASLHADGVLTDAEFNTEKAKILAG